jgi:hypothetical protein
MMIEKEKKKNGRKIMDDVGGGRSLMKKWGFKKKK